MQYVAYYRVSTAKQHRSGLGLAAQKSSVDRFLQPDDELVAEFVETVSGKRDDRVELQGALKAARRTGAKIVIAKLDRFSRKVSFIASMMESDVGFVVADMPNATEFQLHIFAALAQEERRLISSRTKAALAEAKRRGVRLGVHGATLAEKNRFAAIDRSKELLPHFPEDWTKMSYSALARYLNECGVKTSNGALFYPQTIKNVMKRLSSTKSGGAASADT